MNKTLIIIFFILAILITPVFSQENEDDDYIGVIAYTTGDQLFTINAGPIIPLFTWAPSPGDGDDYINSLEGVSVGVAGSLNWGTFIADNFLLGIDLGGMLSWTANRTLSMIPISFRTAYYFMAYPFEIPVYLNTGFSFNTLDDYFTITPCLRPGVGAYWNMNGEWAFGINAEYWFMPELYFDSMAEQTRIANFLQFSISAVYHF